MQCRSAHLHDLKAAWAAVREPLQRAEARVVTAAARGRFHGVAALQQLPDQLLRDEARRAGHGRDRRHRSKRGRAQKQRAAGGSKRQQRMMPWRCAAGGCELRRRWPRAAGALVAGLMDPLGGASRRGASKEARGSWDRVCSWRRLCGAQGDLGTLLMMVEVKH